MTIKIGYLWTDEDLSLLWDSPDKLEIPRQGTARFCPVVTEQFKNAYVIRMPYDLHLRLVGWEGQEAKVQLLPQSGIKDFAFEHFIKVHPHKDWTADGRPLIQLIVNMVFVSDTPDVWIEGLPPIMEYRPDFPGRIISYQWNIYDWMRPIQGGIEWMDTKKDLVIKAGEPLQYVRFHTPNREKVELVHCKRTDEIANELNRNGVVKEHLKVSYKKIFKKAGLMRRKKKWIVEQKD